MIRNTLVAVALVCVATLGSARPADEKLVTSVYDIKPLLGDRGKATGFADADAVVKLILETVRVGDLKPGTPGPQLVVRDGGKLEVRTTAEAHGEIKDLLEALERLADVAVDIKAEVIELDPAAFEKLVRALPKSAKGKPGSPVVFATGTEAEDKPTPEDVKALKEVNAILKAGRDVQTSSARLVNGVESTLSARQSVVTFHPTVVNDRAKGPPQFVKEGFTLTGLPVVSIDRRSVRFKLAEQSAAVAGIKKADFGEVGDKGNVVVRSPELEDLGATGSATIADGGALLFRLAYAPEVKVWVVVLRPTIFIQAEEDGVKK